MDELAQLRDWPLLEWMATYVVHCALLAGAVWMIGKVLPPRWVDRRKGSWKFGLVGALLTVSVQTALSKGALGERPEFPGSRHDAARLAPNDGPVRTVRPDVIVVNRRDVVVMERGDARDRMPSRGEGPPDVAPKRIGQVGNRSTMKRVDPARISIGHCKRVEAGPQGNSDFEAFAVAMMQRISAWRQSGIPFERELEGLIHRWNSSTAATAVDPPAHAVRLIPAASGMNRELGDLMPGIRRERARAGLRGKASPPRRLDMGGPRQATWLGPKSSGQGHEVLGSGDELEREPHQPPVVVPL